MLKDWIHVGYVHVSSLLNLSLQEFASTAWNSGSGCVSAEDRKEFPFVDMNIELDSQVSPPSAIRLHGKGQFTNQLISRHGRVISRLRTRHG